MFAIPASGAGVERLFNSARDICHYRRGSLKPTTIQDLMMYLCTTRLGLEEEQRILLSDGDSDGQRSETDNNVEMSDQEDFISDNEELDHEEDDLIPDCQVRVSEAQGVEQYPPSPIEQAEREETIEQSESNSDDDLPSPQSQHTGRSRIDSQRKRISTRVRIPSKRLKGYVAT